MRQDKENQMNKLSAKENVIIWSQKIKHYFTQLKTQYRILKILK